MKKMLTVVLNDFRLVFRDNVLKIFFLLPLLYLLVIRYGIPPVAGFYTALQDYLPLILMLATMQGSIAFGFIYSMVLVDEKDTSVAKVYGILPISKFWFVIFRLIPPFFLATVATTALLFGEPFYGLSIGANVAYSIVSGLSAPLTVLLVATVSKNKIEAMTWLKLFNIPLFLPVFAFFVPSPFSAIFAIFPAYWGYVGLDFFFKGENGWIYLMIGFAYNILLITLLAHRFTKLHFK